MTKAVIRPCRARNRFGGSKDCVARKWQQYGPETKLYIPPKLTLLPKVEKPAPKFAPAAQSRMEKVTGVEKRLMAQERIEMSKRSSEWGYLQKLVKRGLYRQTATQGHMVTFQKISVREQVGSELSAMIAGKVGFTSYSSLKAGA